MQDFPHPTDLGIPEVDSEDVRILLEQTYWRISYSMMYKVVTKYDPIIPEEN